MPSWAPEVLGGFSAMHLLPRGLWVLLRSQGMAAVLSGSSFISPSAPLTDSSWQGRRKQPVLGSPSAVSHQLARLLSQALFASHVPQVPARYTAQSLQTPPLPFSSKREAWG